MPTRRAVGRITPGPVVTTAAFVGYPVAGGPGAAVTDATTALPAIASGLLLIRFRINSAWLVAGAAAVGRPAHP